MDVPASHPRIAVIGIGSEFRRDDAVGRAVVAALARRGERCPMPPGTALFDCDGEPARLLDLWQGTRLAVVVDAAFGSSGRPGHIWRMDATGVLRAVQPGPAGSHGLGLRAAVELAGVLGRLPDRLVVYAVQGADSTPGSAMSAPVRAAVRPLARRIAGEIAHCARTATS